MKPVKTDYKEEQKESDGLLSRWGKRKQAVKEEKEIIAEFGSLEEQRKAEEAALPTDKDMPPLASLTPDSDYSVFMSPKVSDALRRLALRKLFHGAEFNICDGLDDYDGDYTSFAKLGDIVTADMKHQIEMEARKKARALKEKEAEELKEKEREEKELEAKEIEAKEVETSEKLETETAEPDKDKNNSPDLDGGLEKTVSGQGITNQDEYQNVKPQQKKLSAMLVNTENDDAVEEVNDETEYDDDDLDGGLPG